MKTRFSSLASCPALLVALAAFFLVGTSSAVCAETLPEAVQAETKTPLVAMGSGIYRKFGFSVYRITFWTAEGTWDKKKPYALEIRYMRDLSKDTLVDAVTDDLRDEHVASDETLDGWNKILNDNIPDIKEGDTVVSLCLPGQKKSPLFYNEQVMFWSDDHAFIDAFFNIWLGPTADQDLRSKLLGKS